ncbi:MAG TPA: S8 family peptidase [Solirubrobacterales bacterium]|nr:S8 family peptidase [Solirubrobacterales bacterium]
MRQGRLLRWALAAACAATISPATVAAAPAAPGELLVRFDPALPASDRADVRQAAGTPVERGLPLPGLQLVRVPDGDVAGERAALERSQGVLYAEPNFVRSLDATPNDPYFGLLWGLHNTGQTISGTAGTADADIDAPEAWDVTTGSPGTVVAVVDSGVDAGHPDLAPQEWRNPGESGAGKETNGTDDDHNGYVDDFRGWDWVSQDGDPDDENGHGTHVAGTVAARGNDGQGVTGVSWQARVMALRALDEDGDGTVADVVDAYAYAAARGAPIVNASLGAPGFSFTEYDTLRNLPNTLFVVAAGNDGESNETNPHYPCSYNLANIVCVAASTNRDGMASFSNYGATTVDLAAPGRNILSAWPGGGHQYASGTSMATPHVAGAAALLHSHFGGVSVAALRHALLAGVEPKPAFAGKTVTGGRLNVRQSLGVPLPAPPPPSAAPPAADQTDRVPPRVVVALTGSRRLRTVIRRGLKTVVRCSEACVVRLDTFVARSTARRLGIITGESRKRVGSAYARLASARRKVVVVRLGRSAARRLNRAARRGRPESLRLELRTRAADLAGNRLSTTRAVRLR